MIEVKNVSKKFMIAPEGHNHSSIKSFLQELISRNRSKLPRRPFWAVQDVSFTINEGELVGILGHNGSGKSTLLKMIAQITQPTKGQILVTGHLGSMLEIGTGMHNDLSGRDNIFFCGAILGMKRSDILRQFDNIVDFADISAFLDTPLKRYSSGMALRLASSVLFHLKTDLLILDEVLSVGDFQYQARCFEKVKQIAKEGRAILCVTHHETWISNFCTRAILMHHGQLIHDGLPEPVLKQYHDLIDNDPHLIQSESQEMSPV